MNVSWRRNVIDGLLSVYGFANRRGLLDAPLAREAFARSYFLYKQAVEDPFAALLRKHPQLFAGGHVLDVGANIGYTAAVFARGLSPGYRVYAFEPEAKNFAQLERSVTRLGLEAKVTPLHAAAGATDGTIELWRNEGHHADHRIATESLKAATPGLTAEQVRLVSLDQFTAELGPIAFVKIDVQGYETEVLAGMKRLLQTVPALAVEYMPEAMQALGFDPAAMLAALGGYHLQVINHDGSLSPFDISATGEKGYADLLCTRSRS